MSKEEQALKALAKASQKMLADFVASDEGQQWLGDGYAGLGVLRITSEGKMQRVAPSDFRIPGKVDAP